MLASAAIAAACLLVPIETIYFASLRPDYTHVANTISELAETGAPRSSQVSFGFFLPVGLLVCVALLLARRNSPSKYVTMGLFALSSLGFGYLAAAFFPCDLGAPLFGSWRTQIHNLAGFVDYAGTGIGLLIIARHFARQRQKFAAVGFLIAGALVLLCLSLLSQEAAFPIRGAIQRVAEFTQFVGVLFCITWCQRKSHPSEREYH